MVCKNSYGPLRYLECLGEACCVGQIYPPAHPKPFLVRPSPTVHLQPHWTECSSGAHGCRLSSIKHSGRRTSFRKKTRSRFKGRYEQVGLVNGGSFLGKLYTGTLMQLNANSSLLTAADNSLSNRENPPCLSYRPKKKFTSSQNSRGSFLYSPSLR